MGGHWCYLLECADGSFYVGTHRGSDVTARVAQHNQGEGSDYTSGRLPVTMMWCQEFDLMIDAISAEKRIKGWSRRKKMALASENWSELKLASKRRAGAPRPSRPPDGGTSG
ncbi:MAG: GIY-YIG nuclease family protein [Alphaproteobacteria bacterium]|nr:GIY-YIG nuclease family protein [Alphaproteobacteria bacterium]